MKMQLVAYRKALVSSGSAAVLLLLAHGSLTCLQGEKEPLEGDRVALAYVSSGFLFSSYLPKLDPRDYTDLNSASDSVGCFINKSPLQDHVTQVNWPLGPSVPRYVGIPHWTIRYGFYWSMGSLWSTNPIYRIRLTEVDLYDPKNRSQEAIKRQDGQNLEFSGKPPTHFNPIGFVHVEEVMNYKFGDPDPFARKGMYEDVLPIGQDSVLAFINWDGNMRTWEGKYIKDKEGKWCTEWNSKVIEKIEPGFSEPFYVWAKDSDFFFVTRSGRLYYSKKPASGIRKATALWSDGRRLRDPMYDGNPKSFEDYKGLEKWLPRYLRGEKGIDKNPIRGLIFDADSNRGFAFTRPKPEEKDQRPMYFEITAPLTPRPYPGFKLDKPPENYTLRTLMEYAQFLIAKKEIKIKP
jgi:hypothetical protein